MTRDFRNIIRGVASRFLSVSGDYRHLLTKDKIDLIDMAIHRYDLHSILDAGGCWGVHGGYTFHALSNSRIKNATIIDTNITDTTKKRSESHPHLKLVNGDFGDRNLVKSLGDFDAVIFYDVLLHQVNPNWNEIIDMYSSITNHFIIYNQMFTGSHSTIRLTDLGLEEYLKNTPYNGNEEFIIEMFSKIDQNHPEHNKVYGDVHHYWQWGISPPDLFSVMSRNNFRADYLCNYGKFSKLPYFENHGILFSRIKRHPKFSNSDSY
ncbi:MAG: hypothetical protein O7G83_11925 [Proteobacteria bacterium]|nr:hypothetical protein [Pseudomonadota bacterium]